MLHVRGRERTSGPEHVRPNFNAATTLRLLRLGLRLRVRGDNGTVWPGTVSRIRGTPECAGLLQCPFERAHDGSSPSKLATTRCAGSCNNTAKLNATGNAATAAPNSSARR